MTENVQWKVRKSNDPLNNLFYNWLMPNVYDRERSMECSKVEWIVAILGAAKFMYHSTITLSNMKEITSNHWKTIVSEHAPIGIDSMVTAWCVTTKCHEKSPWHQVWDITLYVLHSTEHFTSGCIGQGMNDIEHKSSQLACSLKVSYLMHDVIFWKSSSPKSKQISDLKKEWTCAVNDVLLMAMTENVQWKVRKSNDPLNNLFYNWLMPNVYDRECSMESSKVEWSIEQSILQLTNA